jgi:restriction endonuclease S subunit
MAINGCIHDGWLLIRNSQSLFNLPYLCVLLGTEGMLSQYRASAAGSTVNNLNKQVVGDTLVNIPTMQEQTKIGSFFETLDSLITLHQRNGSETSQRPHD